MSIKKNKKIPKNFRCYPGMAKTTKDTSAKLGVSETDVIEAGLAFFLDCPRDIQSLMLAHYHMHVAQMFDPKQAGSKTENVLRLIDIARAQAGKKDIDK
jgi:hypothetical protein